MSFIKRLSTYLIKEIIKKLTQETVFWTTFIAQRVFFIRWVGARWGPTERKTERSGLIGSELYRSLESTYENMYVLNTILFCQEVRVIRRQHASFRFPSPSAYVSRGSSHN